MAGVIGVHGILNQYAGESTLSQIWTPRVQDGLRRAKYSSANTVNVDVVYYGDFFRAAGVKSAEIPVIGVEDLDPVEVALLSTLAEPLLEGQALTKGVPRSAQTLLRLLMGTKFFEALAGSYGQRALLFGLRQVRLYLHDPDIRHRAQQRFAAAVKLDTRVVIGHSLGSVVAYEALCTGQYPQIRAFVSIGSPLGMRPIIFDCLNPKPVSGRGMLVPVQHWHNVADNGDPVALVKNLCPLFGAGQEIVDARVNNGWHSHDVSRYLTSPEVGLGVANGL